MNQFYLKNICMYKRERQVLDSRYFQTAAPLTRRAAAAAAAGRCGRASEAAAGRWG